MFKRNPYVWTGLALLVAGGLVFLAAYFIIGAIWLIALSICLSILSFILIALSRTVPRIPPEVASLLLETGIDNIATIVEELGIKSRAIYLPSSLTGGRAQALIPLHYDGAVPELVRTIPRRLIVRYGAGPDDIGLLLSTIGSTAVGMLGSRPAPSATGLEDALASLLNGTLGVAEGVSVRFQENHIKVEVNHPRIEVRPAWSDRCLGGPLASIVASVAAEANGKAVVIRQEEHGKGRYSIELEVGS